MNVSAAKTQENTTKVETAKVETAKNDTSVNKKEETKTTKDNKSTDKTEDTKQQESDFKKLLSQKDPEKGNTEGLMLPQQQNQMNLNNFDENFANKFSFETGGLNTKNFDLTMNYSTLSISKDDAKFFADMVDNKQFAVQESGGKTSLIKFADEIGPTYKTQQTSKTLTSLIEKAYNEQKPVRIDFDNNVSVIMKIDKNGKVSAEFIPGDKAVEEYLRNNIRSLKQRFDDESIAYNDIFYRQSRKQNQHQRKNKGE